MERTESIREAATDGSSQPGSTDSSPLEARPPLSPRLATALGGPSTTAAAATDEDDDELLLNCKVCGKQVPMSQLAAHASTCTVAVAPTAAAPVPVRFKCAMCSHAFSSIDTVRSGLRTCGCEVATGAGVGGLGGGVGPTAGCS